MKTISFKHSGNVGDIIYSIPALMSVLKNKNVNKADYYLNLNQRTGYSGWHPLGNFLLNKDFADKIIPLLKSQSCINDVKIYKGEHIDVDFDNFRNVPINPFTYSIPRWYFLFIIGANWDLSNPWVDVEPDETYKDFVLVSRNNRYKSKFINYKFVTKEQAKKIVYVGVEKEYLEFKSECKHCDNFYTATDFLEFARKLKGCKAFIGCAGFPYALAESLKVKRMVETNNVCGTVIPSGGECYEALFQKGFEHWFKYLIGEEETENET